MRPPAFKEHFRALAVIIGDLTHGWFLRFEARTTVGERRYRGDCLASDVPSPRAEWDAVAVPGPQ